MARIFNVHFSLRKVALVALETVILTLILLPITDHLALRDLLRGGPIQVDRYNGPLHAQAALTIMLVRVLFLVVVAQICFFFNDLYNWKITSTSRLTYLRVLEAVSYTLILVAIGYFGFNGLGQSWLCISTKRVFLCVGAILVVAYNYRIVFNWTLFKWKLRDRLLVVGTSSLADLIARALNEISDPGYEIAGFVVPETIQEDPNRRILGKYQDPLYGIVAKHGINRIIVATHPQDATLPINELLNCRIKGVNIEEAALFYERLTNKIALEKLHPAYLIFSEGFVQHKSTFILKRIMDLGISITGLLLALPIMLITAAWIKLDSKGPVFHKQNRVGREGTIFTLLKFRSMYVDAEKHTGPVWAQKNDSRITRPGRIIRKLRIDEIPQMINVLRNEMSFVGPRPERPYFVEELKKDIPYYTERLVVKPGITGWAQVNYMYGSSKKDALQKLQYDLYYIKNMSIFLDLLVLIKTIKVVIRRQGAL